MDGKKKCRLSAAADRRQTAGHKFLILFLPPPLPPSYHQTEEVQEQYCSQQASKHPSRLIILWLSLHDILY
jgi:hypothetical protein